jgi:radical SAM protein with 4Fe4S-binding SPASM domain
MMDEIYITLNDKLFFQRMKLDGEFRGSARIYDFEGARGIELNEDAYAILELIDSGYSLNRCLPKLALRYGIPEAELEPTVQVIVNQLIESGLATIAHSRPAARKPLIPQCREIPHKHTLEKTTIELTSKCNLACKHCYGSFHAGTGADLDKEVAIEVLSQMRALQCCDIQFTGGEPLMHRDFWDILDMAVNHYHFVVSISSNGTLFTAEAVRRLKQIGRVDVNISIDGHTAEINDFFRGEAGAFKKAVDAVKLLDAEGFRVKIVHTVHRDSLPFVNQMWDLADMLGVEILLSQAYRIGRCSETAGHIHVEPREFYRAIHSTRHRLASTPPKESPATPTKEAILRCEGGYEKIAVRFNGDVTPCIAYPHTQRFVMGNIRDHSIEEIFYGFDSERILGRNNPLEIKECEHCPSISTCKSGCLAIAFAETGCLDRKDPFSCARYRALID